MNACRPCRARGNAAAAEIRAPRKHSPPFSSLARSSARRENSMQADRFRWLLVLAARPLRPPSCSPFASARLAAFDSRRAFHVSSALSAKKKKAMPPKKAPAPEKKTLLGRPGNNLKIGIVGLFHFFPSLSPASPPRAPRSAQRRQVLLLQHPLQDRSVSVLARSISSTSPYSHQTLEKPPTSRMLPSILRYVLASMS